MSEPKNLREALDVLMREWRDRAINARMIGQALPKTMQANNVAAEFLDTNATELEGTLKRFPPAILYRYPGDHPMNDVKSFFNYFDFLTNTNLVDAGIALQQVQVRRNLAHPLPTTDQLKLKTTDQLIDLRERTTEVLERRGHSRSKWQPIATVPQDRPVDLAVKFWNSKLDSFSWERYTDCKRYHDGSWSDVPDSGCPMFWMDPEPLPIGGTK